MTNEIYANNNEVACKAGAGKTVCAFPDVCMTPPENPATPPGVPVPYPNTGMASDTTDGSRSVQISGQEVMLKNKSYFKTSTGDEAGCAAKKGVISSQNKGKVYFIAWSMDVKIEGENVVRNLDMTTNNHASPVANESLPWPFLDSAALSASDHPCAKAGYVAEVNENCTVPVADDCSEKCCSARKCVLVPEEPDSCGGCGKKTPHHPIPVAELSQSRTSRAARRAGAPGQARGTPRYPKYSSGAAPCICVDGANHDERDPVSTRLMEHGQVGAKFAQLRNAALPKGSKLGHPYPFSTALDCGAKAVSQATGCDEECTKRQLEKGHADMGVSPGDQAFKSKQKANVPEFEKPPGPPDAEV